MVERWDGDLPDFDGEDDLEYVTHPDGARLVAHQRRLEVGLRALDRRMHASWTQPGRRFIPPPRWLLWVYVVCLLLSGVIVPWEQHVYLGDGEWTSRVQAMSYDFIWSPPMPDAAGLVASCDLTRFAVTTGVITLAVAVIWLAHVSKRLSDSSAKEDSP